MHCGHFIIHQNFYRSWFGKSANGICKIHNCIVPKIHNPFYILPQLNDRGCQEKTKPSWRGLLWHFLPPKQKKRRLWSQYRRAVEDCQGKEAAFKEYYQRIAERKERKRQRQQRKAAAAAAEGGLRHPQSCLNKSRFLNKSYKLDLQTWVGAG